jgi:hypothetical protein
VAGERLLRILSMLASQGADLTTARLCEVCVEVTAVSGAGIMLKSGDAAHGSVCTSNEVSALIEQLQFAMGEGPEVAEDVVARRLRFDARGGGSGPAS